MHYTRYKQKCSNATRKQFPCQQQTNKIKCKPKSMRFQSPKRIGIAADISFVILFPSDTWGL